MATLNLSKFELLWFCEGFIGRSHLRWDGYRIMVDDVYPQLDDNEREFIYTYIKRDTKWHWEDRKFIDKTPYEYWLQMLARYNPANQVHVWLKDGTETDAYRWNGRFYVSWNRICDPDGIVKSEAKAFRKCANTLCQYNDRCVRYLQRGDGGVIDMNTWRTEQCDLLITNGDESGYKNEDVNTTD